MNVHHKDATITNTDDAFPGSFRVVLSAPTKDRDGDTLLPEEWKQPLPDHITFDIDHGMSVATTVGSGKPSIDAEGRLIVDGTYSSLQYAQDARTLVNEGHINKTSVAFMTEKVGQKDGSHKVVRELLNGAFVAVPANREAVVLESKGLKSGRRNSATDQAHLDAIATHAVALGAVPRTGGDTDADEDVAAAKSFRAPNLKAVEGSYEQRQQAINDALDAQYRVDTSDAWVYAYPLATFEDTVVFRVSGDSPDVGQWQAPYTLNSDGTVTLGDPARVSLVEQILPVSKSLRRKDADTAAASDPAALIPAIDAAIDSAIDLLATVDVATLPAEVRQAIALIQAADASVDELMDALGIPDPDEDADSGASDTAATGAAKAAPVAAAKAAPAEDDKSEIEARAARLRLLNLISER